jgi:hypothetical protein
VFPRESNSGMVPTTGITPNDVSSNEASKYSNGVSASTGAASHLRKPKPSRRCRECVHGVDNVSEDKSSVRQRIRTKTCSNIVFATILGRMRAHDGPGQRSPGPPHPPPGWNAGTLELRGTQTTDKLSYVLVGSNRQTKSPVGLQKGNILPKMGSVSFSMSDSR